MAKYEPLPKATVKWTNDDTRDLAINITDFVLSHFKVEEDDLPPPGLLIMKGESMHRVYDDRHTGHDRCQPSHKSGL